MTAPIGRTSPTSDLPSDTHSSRLEPLDSRHRHFQSNVRRKATEMFMAHYSNPSVRNNRWIFEELLEYELLSSSLIYTPAEVETILQSLMQQFLHNITLQATSPPEIHSHQQTTSTMNPDQSLPFPSDAGGIASAPASPATIVRDSRHSLSGGAAVQPSHVSACSSVASSKGPFG